jgi:PKD repeat protein
MPRFSLAVLVSTITLAAIAAACGDQRKSPAKPIVSAPEAGAESSPTLALRADRRGRALHAIRSDNLVARHADHWRARPAYHRPVAMPGGNDAALSTYRGVEGTAVAFDGSGSRDADRQALTYAWDFGDGSAATAATADATASHIYARKGTFAATLTVTDARGVAVSRTVPVVVLNVAPTATFSAPATVNEGENFTLAVTNVHDASAIDRQSLTFAYDCGRGFGAATAAASVQCSAADSGAISAHVKVIDEDGGVTQYDATVNVRYIAPAASVRGPTTISSGDTYTLDGSIDDPHTNDGPWTYVVNWGTGNGVDRLFGLTQTRGAITANHRYLEAGTYTVALDVAEQHSGTLTATTIVTVLRIGVSLDIEPGDANSRIKVNERSNGDLRLAILSSASFDAHDVDVASARIGNAAVAVAHDGTLMASYEDVNDDGRPDLVLHFNMSALLSVGGLTTASTSLTVLANLSDGRQIAAAKGW